VREDTRSLWEQYQWEVEPWRRGRLFLICFGLLSAVSDLLGCALLILGGLIEGLLVFGVARTLFWLQFYLIWIGVHWVRWLQGSLNAIQGFALFIWSLQSESGAMMTFGIFLMGTGIYLAFAPSIYFFAKRQQQRRSRQEALLAAAAFGVLLLSLAAGVAGLFRYKLWLQEDAENFADLAFTKIFAQHETYFLLDSVTPRLLEPPFGREYLTQFLRHAAIFAGDVHQIQKAKGQILVRYGFPFYLVAQGDLLSKAMGRNGPLLLRIRINGTAGDWKIDSVAWWYSNAPEAAEAYKSRLR